MDWIILGLGLPGNPKFYEMSDVSHLNKSPSFNYQLRVIVGSDSR